MVFWVYFTVSKGVFTTSTQFEESFVNYNLRDEIKSVNRKNNQDLQEKL